MSTWPQAHWNHAKEALRAARVVLDVSPSAAASRAYYSAFHAVSALFALEGIEFRKHTALQSAVHRGLALLARHGLR